MIASLHGVLESLASDGVVVNVNGIGFRVFLPTSVLSSLGSVGKEVHLHTYLHLREDNVALYGFISPDELRLFQTLLTVSGLGPKLTLALLSTLSPEQLALAIAGGNTDLLTTVPGIGKKTAGRIILELKDKVGAGWVTAPGMEAVGENGDVLTALVSLGYSAAEASQAVASLPRDKALSLEERVRLALQYFGGR